MKREFHSIQLLRALGALLVVYTHLTSVQENFPDRMGFLPAGWFGGVGVDLFFVLSGFIIFYVAEHRERRPADFVMRRFYRIFPVYVLFTLAVLAAMAFDPNLTFGFGRPDMAAIVKSLTLWPQDRYPVLFVGWSIEHELIFYAVIGLLLYAGRLKWAPIVLMIFFVVGLAIGNADDAAVVHLFSKYNLEFLMGMLIYRWQPRLQGIGSVAPALVSIGLLALVLADTFGPIGVAHQPTLARTTIVGFAAALLLLSFLNAEERLHHRALLPLIAIGDASYVLYLSHPFILSMMGKIGVAIGITAGLVMPWMAVSLAAALAFALLFHRAVEAPFLRYARRSFGPHRPVQPSANSLW